MKIKKLKLKNFQCFNKEEIELDDLTTFIGANSSGKTAVQEALMRLFGRDRSQRNIKNSDFYLAKGENFDKSDKKELSLEVIIDLPEIKEKNEKEMKMNIPHIFSQMVVDDVNEDPYLRILLKAEWQKGLTLEGEIEVNRYFVKVPEGEDIEEEDLVKLHSHHRALIQVIYVPAVRQPSKQLKNVSGSILGRLLNNIKWDDNKREEIKTETGRVNKIIQNQKGIEKLQTVVQTNWDSYHQDTRYKNADIGFNERDLDDILKNLQISFNPTFDSESYNVEKLGDGLRSLFYLSLVQSLLSIEQELKMVEQENKIFDMDVPVLTLLAVEEPENHVSPHLLGKIIKNLKTIASQKNAQVTLTSHSPGVVRRMDPESIKYLRICKDKLEAVSNKILLPEKNDDAFKYIKEAVCAYPELYFARLVILGEGDSEELILSRILELLGPEFDLDSYGISIVPLGGRHVNHFWKLLNQLNIPHITLLDLDLERNTGGWQRIKYVIDQLIENGHDRKEFIEKIDSESQLSNMNNWKLRDDSNLDRLNKWINKLEDYDVYFSYPLDIDFSMLKSFTKEYQKTIPKNGGPKINDYNAEERDERAEKDMKDVLKSAEAEGNFYKDDMSLMIWYKYFFLTRGKPATHIMALSNIKKDKLKENLPELYGKLLQKIKKKLVDDPFSALAEEYENA